MKDKKKSYGFIFEVSWVDFIVDYLKHKNISYKKYEKNKLTIIEFKDKRIIIGKRPNSPGIAVDLELMKMYFNVKKVFRLGTCGGYHKNMKVADILICTEAIRGEGTSKCYVSDLAYPATCDFLLTTQINNLLSARTKRYFTGTLWTTDGRIVGQYDRKRILELIKNKVVGVDMDSSSFFIVSKLLGMQSSNLSVAVDKPLKDKEYSEFSYEEAKTEKALELCCNVFMDYVFND